MPFISLPMANGFGWNSEPASQNLLRNGCSFFSPRFVTLCISSYTLMIHYWIFSETILVFDFKDLAVV